MSQRALAMSRYGGAAGTLLSTAVAVAIFVWTFSIVAVALDSILVALVVTTMVLLPLASPLAKLSRPSRMVRPAGGSASRLDRSGQRAD